MIIGEHRDAVIENIKRCAEAGDFHAKVEIDDPFITSDEENEITKSYLVNRKSVPYKFKSFFARVIANVGTEIINKDTEIVGDVDAKILKKGAIITSNHFSPMENTVIRHFVRKKGIKKLNIVSQVGNFAMNGVIGFLMKYADTVPISNNIRYLARDLVGVLREKLYAGEVVLIYPEQEMWFNYRKVRPFKCGAYHFSAKLRKPIVSCFVEIIDKDKLENDDFCEVRYRLHILGVLYPDEKKTLMENCEQLCKEDYELKKNAYERIYGKPLTYEFEQGDIAGWLHG